MLDLAIVEAMLNDRHNPIAAIEQHCIIENVIYESIGEGEIGMQLVAEVTLNRVDHPRFSNNDSRSCRVVRQPAQFSWTLKDEDDLIMYTKDEYMKAAQVTFSVMYDAVERILPRHIVHYINPDLATDLSWYDPRKVVYAYGGHEFLDL